MIGTELAGRYHILEMLGEGGMGLVYLAEHIHLRRKEAIKVLSPKLATSPKFVARFRREARATNRLQHSNIVTVYDFGQLPDGRFFLAMEHADGESLKQTLLRLTSLPVPRVLRILTQLADAVDHAHSRGVIHRDLKPHNMILVEHRGHSDVLKVLDFGIAKIIAPDYQESVGLSKSGELWGTPGYVAPETFRGDANDPRIDIYAVGCVAFEMLVGEPPFRGGWASVMHDVMNKRVPAPSTRSPHAAISEELDRIVLRCLERNPDDRYQTGRDLAAELRRLPGFQAPDSSRRNSIRAMPDNSEAVAAPGVRSTRSTAIDMRAAVAEPSAVRGSAHTMSFSREEAQFEFRIALKALAGALVDLGCSDFHLSIGITDVGDMESQLQRNDQEMEHLGSRGEEAEQRAREREARLRFAIGDLRFDRDQASARGEPSDPSVDHQIAQLEERLQASARDLAAELTEIQDREIAIVASRARLDDRVTDLAAALDRVIEEIVPSFADHPGVSQLHGQLRGARQMLALGGPQAG